MKTKTIKQTAKFEASPEKVYKALMSSKEHAAFTGGAAKISGKVGGKFSVFDGYARGKNVELEPGKKIVQEWTCSDFPEGHLSLVTFALKPTKAGTTLSFTHKGVPSENFESIKDGWVTYYWEPMVKHFEPKKAAKKQK